MKDDGGVSKKKKIKVKNSHIPKKKLSISWIFITVSITFLLSVFISLITNIMLEDVSLGVAFTVLLVIIFMGIFFDMLGVAVTAAAESPFHAMASSRVKGAKESVKLIRSAEKVSNFCNDVIGDICGIISGSAGAVIITALASRYSVESMWLSLLTTACIAALTVAGKSLGKTFGMSKSNTIVFVLGKFIAFFKFGKY